MSEATPPPAERNPALRRGRRPARLVVAAAIFCLGWRMGTAQDLVRDDLGAVFPAAGSYRRIVSLAPNITEILFGLGAGNRVIGVTRYCDFPAEARLKVKIGGFLDPDLEAIRTLGPDLVIGFRGNPLEALDRLKAMGLPVFVLDIGNDLEAVPRTIEKIGRVTGQTAEAASLVEAIGAQTRCVEAALRDLPSRPRVFLKLQGEGLWTCGRASYLTSLIEKAGGTSVSGSLPKNWLEYSIERLTVDDPEVIVILARSAEDFERTRSWFRAQPGLRGLRSVRTDALRYLDENAASRFGPRLFEALVALARLLHPGRFEAGAGLNPGTSFFVEIKGK